MISKTIDMGNNEQASHGVFPQEDGTFLAMTLSRSKHFKTFDGALHWYCKNGGSVAAYYGLPS